MLSIKVVTGGQYDVDVVLEGPNHEILYQQTRSQFDSHQFTTDVSVINNFVYAILNASHFITHFIRIH